MAKRKPISYEDFIRAWEAHVHNGGVRKVAEQLGISTASVQNKASILRKAKIPLSRAKRQGIPIDVPALTKLTRELQKKYQAR
jgi:hypothetical protein